MNWGSAKLTHWIETGVFHKSSMIEKKSLKCFPPPFNKPDFVVFEGFYSVDSARFAKELRSNRIPYIITPRGSLTKQARHNGSEWKKRVAHWLFFDSFVKNATSIQFLTKQENDDSISQCPNSFILPNGYLLPEKYKSDFSSNGIKVVFIGRIDIYHKGLDLLIDASVQIIDDLRKANVKFDIYGPYNEDASKLEKIIVEKKLKDLFVLKGEVTGEKKENVLLDADVFILTSRFEGHPMGLMEALAYGLPVLVTEGANMKEEIQKADAGWGCNTSRESIKECLLKMISDQRRFSEKSKNARDLSKQYDWHLLAERFHLQLQALKEAGNNRL
jgi:glycosyltransferase involved in cell wall biosynthesis